MTGALVALLAACAQPARIADATLHLTAATNYTLDLALDVPPTEVAERTDILVDWSGLTRDLRGRPVDPAKDVVFADLLWFRALDADALAERLLADDIAQADVTAYAQWKNPGGATSLRLGQLLYVGGTFPAGDFFVEGDGVWLLRLVTASGDDAMVALLAPVAGGPAAASVGDASAAFVADADLEVAEPLVAVAGTSPEVEWAALAEGARGEAIDELDVATLVVARFDDLAIPALEAGVLALDEVAAVTYVLDVYGETGADLSDARAGDEAFPGFDAAGVWLVGLRCDGCGVPAPAFLGRMDVK